MSDRWAVHHGDCREVMQAMDAESVDSIVSDPPYGLSFMGKGWDHGVPGVEFWEAALRVAKPGCHLLAFGGTRTFHRLTVAIEDAGWDIRDCLMWVYGSGFPKSHDVSKAIDREAGAEREVVGTIRKTPSAGSEGMNEGWVRPWAEGKTTMDITAPATDTARQWQGWGTALKPSHEPVILARKPLPEDAERDKIIKDLFLLESQLCLLMSDAWLAEATLMSSLAVEKLLDIARWTAEDRTNTRADLFGQMDMSQCELVIRFCLNTVSSWKGIWEDASIPTSTFITAMASSTTIGWKTLRSCVSALTLPCIIRAASEHGGSWHNVVPAAAIFNAVSVSTSGIQTLSVHASAIEQGLISHPAAIDKRRLHRPIILARKPPSGTVAANVLEWGTGAINVDGCRVGFHGEADKAAAAAAAAAAQRACQDQNKNRTAYGEFNNGPASLQPYLDGMDKGRWPANLIHDGSDEVVGLFPANAPSGGVTHQPNRSGFSGFRSGRDDGTNIQRAPDSGSAARFFKCCEPDAMCCLCCLPYAEACNTIEAWKSTLASTAEKRGWTSRATSEFIARVIAIGPASEKIVPHVKSAGSLCDSCAISIAVALVATKTSAFSNEELQAILASTGNYSECILIPSLAYFAELWGSIDTIPTTNSLSLLFGSVRDAIANFTRQGTMGRAELRSAASRFAYLPKASKRDRDEGCEGLDLLGPGRTCYDSKYHEGGGKLPARTGNHHPTVKPTSLMRYLCRLITPPDGLVFDPFTGSGSTGKAAMLEGFRFVGAELSPEYIEIARARIGHAAGKTRQKELALA